jgi:phosphoadenosine phosphosulfate reductase
MKIPYLGKLELYWCTDCNVPVLSTKCGRCHADTKKVNITPPGDIRPAFEKDLEILDSTVASQFGVHLNTEDRIVLLNSTSGLDRFDEVIMGGIVIGALKYNLENLRYEFLPRVEVGAEFVGKLTRGYVEVAPDAAEFIKNGKSVLLPGVVGFDKDLIMGQEVVVTCGNSVVAVGKTRLSGEQASQRKKGMFVKVRKYLRGNGLNPLGGGQDWNTVLDANEKVLERCEKEAMDFIRATISANDLPLVVSFSGGKDSLATLLLVRKIKEPIVFFVDTGIEFPETIDYIKQITDLLGHDLIVPKAEDRFWNGARLFGMSGRDYRWCCKVCKLGPVATFINQRFPGGILNFIGQRKYESAIRSKSGRVWRNSWIPKQLSASPIQHWTALHVWLYTMKEKVPANPLYQLGFERIGCWLCPSSSLAEISLIKELHPSLWPMFEEILREQGFTDSEVKFGLWRWRRLPKGQMEFAQKRGLEIPKRTVLLPHSGEHSSRAQNLASSLGSELTEDVVSRASFCLRCGVCLAHCEYDAIEFSEDKVSLNSNCVGCKKCHLKCPVVKYLYNSNYN